MGSINPNSSFGFMPERYLFRKIVGETSEDVAGYGVMVFGKIPKGMPLWYEKEVVVDNLCLYRPNDRFVLIRFRERVSPTHYDIFA